MNFFELMEYPRCEEDDCYCKRHWPNRSGGKEHKVIDNENCGEYTIRCQVWVDNYHPKKCAVCEKYMIDSPLYFPDSDMEVCVRCTASDDLFFDFFMDKFKEDRCFLVKMFDHSFIFPDDTLEDTIDCEKCGRRHLEMDPEDNMLIYPKYTSFELFDGSQECIEMLPELMETIPSFHKIMKEWVVYAREKIRTKRRDKNRQRDVDVRTAMRVIKYFLPKATDSEAHQLAKRKKTLNSIPKSVTSFLEWLND